MTDEVVEEVQVPLEAPAEDAKPEESSAPAKDKPKGGGVQKRISELTAQLRAAQRALEASKAERAKPSEPEGKAPDREQFDDHDAYLEAKAVHVARQEVKSLRDRFEREADEKVQAAERDRTMGEWEARLTDFRDEHPDYDEVAANPSLAISQAMGETILELDNGPSVAYHLGQHPDLAEKIAGMSLIRQPLEIARLAERLTQQTKRKSAAPEPIDPVRPNGGANTDPLSSKLSTEDWMKNRKKQLAEARR